MFHDSRRTKSPLAMIGRDVMFPKKLRVFVASTHSDDLMDHRAKVINDLRKLNVDVVEQDIFPPAGITSLAQSLRKVAECDVFVLLVSFHIGTTPKDHKDTYVQQEYECAKEKKLERFVYLLDEKAELSEELMKRYDKRKTDPKVVAWRKQLEEENSLGKSSSGDQYFNADPSSIHICPALAAFVEKRTTWPQRHVGKQLCCVIPCHAEGPRIVESLRHIVQFLQPYGVALTIVKDNPTADTTAAVTAFVDGLKPELEDGLSVRALPNEYPDKHKMGAIQTGVESIDSDYVLLLDADTILEARPTSGTKGGLECALHTMNTEEPPIDACSFSVLPLKPTGLLESLQLAEYAILTRGMRTFLHATSCISGAGSIWRRGRLLELLKDHSGVFDGDDLELTLLAHGRDYRIEHERALVARTEVPQTLSKWIDQRVRWDRGFFRALCQGRFWKNVGFRATRVGAVYRAIAIADFLLHPAKILAFLYPFFLFFAGAGATAATLSSMWAPHLVPILTGIFFTAMLAGIPSSVYFSDVAPKSKQGADLRIRFAISWLLYTCSPFAALTAAMMLRRLYPTDPPDVIPDGLAPELALSPVQQFLITIGPELGLLFAWSMVWWLPLTWYLLYQSKDVFGETDRIGFAIVLLPFYFLFQILVIRTSVLVVGSCFGVLSSEHCQRVGRATAVVLGGALVLLPVAIFVKAGGHAAHESVDWMESCLREREFKGSKVYFIKSYPNWEDVFWVYDTSLAVMYFTNNGDEKRAASLLEGLRLIQEPNGCWHERYRLDPPGEKTDHKTKTAANSFVVLSAFYYQLKTGDKLFEAAAVKCMDHHLSVILLGKDHGFPGAAMPPELDDHWGWVRSKTPSTRATIATHAACRLAFAATKQEKYKTTMQLLETYLTERAWNKNDNFFERTERNAAGVTERPSIDCQAWAVLTLGSTGPNGEDFSLALQKWCATLERDFALQLPRGAHLPVHGFAFSDEAIHTLSVEGTLQIAAAWYSINNQDIAIRHMKTCHQLKAHNGGVIFAVGARHPDFRQWPAVSATCWCRFNEMTPPFNPLNPIP